MVVASVINHKGGVGKTTFTGCVAQALTLNGFRVLVIDNDSQHNLSSMLGAGVQSPGMADVYRAPAADAPKILLSAVRTTFLEGLHIVTADKSLSVGDVKNTGFLKSALGSCALERFYDFLLIDNAPGLDLLQQAAMVASDKLFVPTELRQFAIDGIAELEVMLTEQTAFLPMISMIIPNFYRESKRQNDFIDQLNRRFPGRVAATAIPNDQVFDDCVTKGRVLFLHKLYSRGAASYLKLVHELFDLNEDDLWETMVDKRKKRIRDEARERFLKRSAVIQGGT